jgi:hypothetical protein
VENAAWPVRSRRVTHGFDAAPSLPLRAPPAGASLRRPGQAACSFAQAATSAWEFKDLVRQLFQSVDALLVCATGMR